MDLTYFEGMVNSVAVVHEGASADGLTHTYRIEEGSKIQIYYSKFQVIDQPGFYNCTKTPQDYRNEVGTGITLEDAQAIVQPRTLSPLQRELMSWHHHIYHLTFRILFHLESMGFLPKQLLECRNKPPLCVACQFGAAHHRPWRTKGNKIGSTRIPKQTEPRNGVSVDQIVSAQSVIIPHILGFRTIQRLWECTTLVDHISNYVYVHLIR